MEAWLQMVHERMRMGVYAMENAITLQNHAIGLVRAVQRSYVFETIVYRLVTYPKNIRWVHYT